MDVPANLRPGAFAGTAEAYARYRPPYPREMLDDLLARAGIGDDASLLDLATGPGRIALDIAGSFARVLAVDAEPEMIAVAERRAAARGIGHITWHVGRAEDLDLPAATLDLITIGEAFHRLEQRGVAASAARWLRPGGCLATLGSDDRFTGDEPWEITLRAVRERWLARAFPDGWGRVLPGHVEGPEAQDGVLRDAGFVLEKHEFERTLELSFEDIVGHLVSTSICSRRALGDDFEAFRSDLRAALGADDTTRFREAIRWGYTLARMPG